MALKLCFQEFIIFYGGNAWEPTGYRSSNKNDVQVLH